jgi:hypothetical protein
MRVDTSQVLRFHTADTTRGTDAYRLLNHLVTFGREPDPGV